jgi:hypothetical protein
MQWTAVSTQWTTVELRQETLGHFDAIYHRFERREQEYHAIRSAP